MNNNSSIPKYIQIQNYILDKIHNGEFSNGDQIPSESVLSKQFGVSRITANSAVKELSTMGFITRIKGKGSFVSDSSSKDPTSNVFSENLKIETYLLWQKHHSLLDIKSVFPVDSIREKLSISKNDKVFEIHRIINHLNQPLFLDYTFIPEKYIISGDINYKAIEKRPIHDYMKTESNISPKYVKLFINTPSYPFIDFSLLHITNINKAMLWETNIYDSNEIIIASTITISNALLYKDNPLLSFVLE